MHNFSFLHSLDNLIFEGKWMIHSDILLKGPIDIAKFNLILRDEFLAFLKELADPAIKFLHQVLIFIEIPFNLYVHYIA